MPEHQTTDDDPVRTATYLRGLWNGRAEVAKVVEEMIARTQAQVEFFAKRGDRQDIVEAFSRDEGVLTDVLDAIRAMEPPDAR